MRDNVYAVIIAAVVGSPTTAVGGSPVPQHLQVDQPYASDPVPPHLRPGDLSVQQVAKGLKQLKEQISKKHRSKIKAQNPEFIIQCRWANGVAIAGDTNPGLIICFDRTMFDN